MKVTIWTRWNPKLERDKCRPKCIYIGETNVFLRTNDLIAVREGFAAERVDYSIYDMVTGELEVHLATKDEDNEYGPCLKALEAST